MRLFRSIKRSVPLGGSTAQVLAKASAADGDTAWANDATGGGASGWTTVTAAAAQNVTNNATLQDSTAIQFTMAASTKYRVRGQVWFDTTAAADVKYQITGPSGATLVRGTRMDCVPAGTPTIRAVDVAYMAAAQALTASATGGAFVSFEYVVHNVTGGAFKMQFAQNTATADTGVNLLAGSYLEYAQV